MPMACQVCAKDLTYTISCIKKSLQSKCYQFHFTDEETKAQRNGLSGPECGPIVLSGYLYLSHQAYREHLFKVPEHTQFPFLVFLPCYKSF